MSFQEKGSWGSGEIEAIGITPQKINRAGIFIIDKRLSLARCCCQLLDDGF
jgi:hypothetical protein